MLQKHNFAALALRPEAASHFFPFYRHDNPLKRVAYFGSFSFNIST